MKKRLLSIITSASVLASVFSFGAYAVPSAVGNMDTGIEYMPEIIEEEQVEAELSSTGPQFVDIMETAAETNTLFGEPDAIEGAFLMSELSGEGTEESPYLIGSADDLLLMASNINSGIKTNAYYKLTRNIDLKGAEWTPVGYVTGIDPYTDYSRAFSGHFDGAGYTISNFAITKDSTAYIGFFGFIYNGSVKNLHLDKVSIAFDSNYAQTIFVGTLAGRVVLNTENSRTNIENCTITNSGINVSGKGTVYAGGIMGVGVSGANGARIFVAFSTAECDINISTSASSSNNLVAAGGIAGYYGALTGAEISAINCHASGNIYTSALKTELANALSGGLFGNLRAYDPGKKGGIINIDSCYSEGTAVAETDFLPYIVGGFAAQFLPTNTSYITNCYSSTDASGHHLQKGHKDYPNNDPVAGGFIGMLDFPGFSSTMGNKIINCYASGDVVDLTHTESSAKDTSFVGGFAGYSTAGIFENCYKLSSQRIWGSDVFTFDCSSLTEDDVKYQDKFVGFDFANTWNFDSDAKYPYPTLKQKLGYAEFVVDGATFDVTVFGGDGKVISPADKPSRRPTVDKVFEFIYWSLEEDGEVFNFGSETVSENTVFHAVFSSAPRPYKIEFLCEGAKFVPDQTLIYGTKLTAPEGIPTKEDNETYFYEFRHWSVIYAGEAFDFTDAVVDGDYTFHAVFEEIDKSAWRGGIAESFSSGHGTETSPYIIRNSEEFALFAKIINENDTSYPTDGYYALGNDINLGGYTWTPIGRTESTPFSANFDGRGYMIKNFVLSDNQYTGIFGYVLNATIKNVHVCDFKIVLSTQKDDDSYRMYAGALAGYVSAQKGLTTSISGIRVSDFECDINVKTNYLYYGSIAGFAKARNYASVFINNSFTEGDIVSVNAGGYNYLGGIAGQYEIGSFSKFGIENCYSTGSIDSTSYRSTYAGGLVGYMFSSDSGALPDVGGTSSESADLAASEPFDIMIKNSFAATSITSETSANLSHSYIGYVVGKCNTYAGIDTNSVFYPRGIGLKLNPVTDAYKDTPSTASSNLLSEVYLGELGFDFENTWMFVADHEYPVLQIMELNKPALRINAERDENNVLNVTVQFVSPSDNYTIMIGVYNERNQLIKFERHSFNVAHEFTEFNTSFENMKNAARISVSAVEKLTLTPLFASASTEI